MLSHPSSLIWASPTSCASRFHFASLIEISLWLPTLRHRISHVHHLSVCKHAASCKPRQSLVVHLTVASNQMTGFIFCDRLTDCIGLTRLTLFTFVTAYLLLRRALTYALRLQPSSSLPSERTIGRVGLTPTAHMTLRGAPQMTPAWWCLWCGQELRFEREPYFLLLPNSIKGALRVH